MKKKHMGTSLFVCTCIALILMYVEVICYASEKEYEYDENGRVTKVIYEDGSYETYEYDKNGNIIQISYSNTTVTDDNEINENDNNQNDNNQNTNQSTTTEITNNTQENITQNNSEDTNINSNSTENVSDNDATSTGDSICFLYLFVIMGISMMGMCFVNKLRRKNEM